MQMQDIWESIEHFMDETGYKQEEIVMVLSELPKGATVPRGERFMGVRLLLDERAGNSVYLTHATGEINLDEFFENMAEVDALGAAEEYESCYYCGHPLMIQLFMLFDPVECPYCEQVNKLD